ncbi:hypothetical protein [Streptomyces sp. NPDC051704]|uniref:hypothetical protein n=1 Tax=Streptomyces sp. NPDC051704 TaxID=3365671 RepID=UPI0037A771F9
MTRRLGVNGTGFGRTHGAEPATSQSRTSADAPDGSLDLSGATKIIGTKITWGDYLDPLFSQIGAV